MNIPPKSKEDTSTRHWAGPVNGKQEYKWARVCQRAVTLPAYLP